MNPMSFILTCMVIWVVLIFIALPIGIKTPEHIEKGHADSAPDNHRVGIKLLITFIMSVILSITYWYFLERY